MSATNTLENSILALIFNATTFADIAENDTTSPATVLYVSLHTGDPGEAGAQNTSESAYTSYARVAVNRNSGGWTVSGNAFSNTAEVAFPACTGSTSTITHFGIGVSSSGAGTLLFKGALSSSLAVSNGITPRFAIGQISGTAD